MLPGFEQIKIEQQKIGEKLNSVDKRLDEINTHLIDQSRRIDEWINELIDFIKS